MFYQSDNSFDSDLLKIESGNNFSFPPHLHGSFELIVVTEGEMSVTVDENQYTLTPGKAILIFPDQVHALSTERQSRHTLCIFSSQLVRAYNNVFKTKLPTDNLFTVDPFYVEQLSSQHECHSILQMKGLLYSVCAEFDAQATYKEKENKKQDLLPNIFSFVENNYKGNCSLVALSEQLSYHSVYLSRYFKQRTGIAFTEYVNLYRINEAAYILKNSQKKILDVAYECGFDSLRSFNRNFKQLMGKTPNEYRNQSINA